MEVEISSDHYRKKIPPLFIMSCRGINRKHLSAGDWFWKIGFHNLLWRWGLSKSFEILRFPFFSISPTSKAGYETKFSKSRHQQRGFCTKKPYMWPLGDIPWGADNVSSVRLHLHQVFPLTNLLTLWFSLRQHRFLNVLSSSIVCTLEGDLQ